MWLLGGCQQTPTQLQPSPESDGTGTDVGSGVAPDLGLPELDAVSEPTDLRVNPADTPNTGPDAPDEVFETLDELPLASDSAPEPDLPPMASMTGQALCEAATKRASECAGEEAFFDAFVLQLAVAMPQLSEAQIQSLRSGMKAQLLVPDPDPIVASHCAEAIAAGAWVHPADAASVAAGLGKDCPTFGAAFGAAQANVVLRAVPSPEDPRPRR